MKEALSQIRHSKSDRPVFTPEFLARIKRIIVFKPLDRAAMDAIARKLLAEVGRRRGRRSAASGWSYRRGWRPTSGSRDTRRTSAPAARRGAGSCAS